MSKKETTGGNDEVIVDNDPFASEDVIVDDSPFGEAPEPATAKITPYSTPSSQQGPVGVPPSKQPADPLAAMRMPAPAPRDVQQTAAPKPMMTDRQARIAVAGGEAQRQVEQTAEFNDFMGSEPTRMWSTEPPPLPQDGSAPRLDPRAETIRSDWVKHGKPQFTQERINARKDAGTWGPQEEFSYVTEPMLEHAKSRLDERISRYNSLRAAAESQGIPQLIDWVFLNGKFLDEASADFESKSPEDQKFIRDLYEEYKQKSQRLNSVFSRFKAEQDEIEGMKDYLSKRYEDGLQSVFKDPKVGERLAIKNLAEREYAKATDDLRKGNLTADVVSAYVARPIANEMLRFGGNIAASGARALDAIGNLPAHATGSEPYYSFFAKKADDFAAHLERIVSNEPKEFTKPIFDDEWNVNESVLPKFLRGGMYMTMLAASGPAGRAAGVSETGAMGSLVMLSSREDAYQEGLRAGLTEMESELFAVNMSLVEAASEMINPGPFIDGGGKKAIMRQALKSLKEGKPMADALGEALKYGNQQGVAEAFEEFVAGRGQELVKKGANLLAGTEFDTAPTLQGIAEELTMGYALGGLMAGGSAMVHRPLFKESVSWAVQNPDRMREYISQQVPEQERQAALDRLDRYIAIYKGVPNGVSPQGKADIAASVAEKERIEKERGSAVVDETVAAAAGGNQFDAAIAAEDERIKEVMQREQEMQQLDALADKMATATDETEYSPEERQLQQNYANELESRLKERNSGDSVRNARAGEAGGGAIANGEAAGGVPVQQQAPDEGAAPSDQGRDDSAAPEEDQGAQAGVEVPAEGQRGVSVEQFNSEHPEFQDIDEADLEGATPHHVWVSDQTDKRLMVTVETDKGPIDLMLDRKPQEESKEEPEPEEELDAWEADKPNHPKDDGNEVVSFKGIKKAGGGIYLGKGSDGKWRYRVKLDYANSGMGTPWSLPLADKEAAQTAATAVAARWIDEQINRDDTTDADRIGLRRMEALVSQNKEQAAKSDEELAPKQLKSKEYHRNRIKESGLLEKLEAGAAIGIGIINAESGYVEARKLPNGKFGAFERGGKSKKPLATASSAQGIVDWAIDRRHEYMVSQGDIPHPDDVPSAEAEKPAEPKKGKTVITVKKARIIPTRDGVVAVPVEDDAEQDKKEGDSDESAEGQKEEEAEKPTRSALSEEDQKKKEAARERMRAAFRKGGKLTSGGIDPEQLEAMVEYGYYIAKEGVLSFAEWVKDVVAAIGLRPDDRVLKGAYNQVRKNAESKDGFNTALEVSAMSIDDILAETPEDDGKGTGEPAVPGRPGSGGSDIGVDDGDSSAPGTGSGEGGAAAEDGAGEAQRPDGESAEVPGSGPSKPDGKVGGDAGGASGGVKGSKGASGRKGKAQAKEPGASVNAVNHRLPTDAEWIPRGQKTRARANIKAIRLVRDLMTEGRDATPEEKAVLAQYVGWGGIKPAVDIEKAALAERFRTGRIPYWDDDSKKTAENWIEDWEDIHNELKGLMSEDEMKEAYQSSEYAHYTSRTVINSMWDAVRRLGFKGGKILESAVGVGNFIGLTPQDIAQESEWLAIDKDAMSANIASKLYPQEDVRHAGYETVKIRPNSLDLVITNVPFSHTGVYDKRYPGLNLHNYFIIRGLDELKPGGIMAVLTSSYTLDSLSPDDRKMMAERADLIGAMRMPNTAFKENAGTSVVADMLFFRKKDDSPSIGQPFTLLEKAQNKEGFATYPLNYNGTVEEWYELSPQQRMEALDGKRESRHMRYDRDKPITVRDFMVNQYFTNNPEMVLGDLSIAGTMRGRNPQMTVDAAEGTDLSQELGRAVSMLPENVFGAKAGGPSGGTGIKSDPNARAGRLQLSEGVPMFPDGFGEMAIPKWYSETADKKKRAAMVSQAEDYLALRDAVEELVSFEASGTAASESLDELRANLNKVYDAYVAKHGHVRDSNKSKFLSQSDRDFPIVGALESKRITSAKGKRKTYAYDKMPIFTEKAVEPAKEPTKAQDADDAMDISVYWRGRVDVPYIASLIGEDEEAVKAILRERGLAYENPRTGSWEEPHYYLSGFVVDKLKEAREAAEQDPVFEANVLALEKVQPEPISIDDIMRPKGDKDTPPGIGSMWIAPRVYERFVESILGLKTDIAYSPEVGKFSISYDNKTGAYGGTQNLDTWGVRHGKYIGGRPEGSVALTGIEIFARAMRQRGLVVEWTYEDVKYADPDASAAAEEKLTEMNAAFVKWVTEDSRASKTVEEDFNKRFNISVRTKYPAPKKDTLPGMASHIMRGGKKSPLKLFAHQMRVVARAVRGSLLFAHDVGFGKTFEMIASAMEMRRIGTAKKPMLVVLNATLKQIEDDIRAMYPNAKIHVPSTQDMEGGPLERNIFMAQAAMGDWDLVVIPHSVLNALPNDPKREEDWIKSEIQELEIAREMAAEREGNTKRKNVGGVSDYNARIESLRKRLQKLLDRKKDDAMTFEQLGVDALFVDESHYYKKLPFWSSLASDRSQKVKGIDTGSNSSQGPNLLLKFRYIQERMRGKGTYMLTGTPVTNTIAEMWTIFRYLRPDILERYGIKTFDAFQTTYTLINKDFERTSTGAVKLVARLTRFRFVQKLIDAWLDMADVQMRAQDIGIKQPGVKGGGPTPQSVGSNDAARDFVAYLAYKYKEWERLWKEDPQTIFEKKLQAIPAKMAAWARLASMDLRYIDPDKPDNPSSKMNMALRDVKRIYDETTNMVTEKDGITHTANGTQMLFCDQIYSVDAIINIYQDIKDKLVKLGIPEHEIALVHPKMGVKSKEQKQAIFDKLNRGEIRVAIGSTYSLGTGVNAQRMVAGLHHLDAPWMPYQITQREGRAIRQGNEIYDIHGRLIEVNRWVQEGTYDGTLWSILTAKADMVGQLIDGSYEGDTIADLGDGGGGMESFAHVKAAATGDPRGLQKIDLQKRIDSMMRSKDAHAKQQRKIDEEILRFESTIPKMEANLTDQERIAKEYGEAFADPDVVSVEIDGVKHEGRKEAVKTLDEWFAGKKKRFPQTENEAISLSWERLQGGRAFISPMGMVSINGKPVEVKGVVSFYDRMITDDSSGRQRLESSAESNFFFNFIDPAISKIEGSTAGTGAGMFISLRKVLDDIQGIPDRTRTSLTQYRRNLDEAKSLKGKEWDKQVAFDEATRELAEVEESLKNSPEPELKMPTGSYYDIFMPSDEIKALAREKRGLKWKESEDDEDEEDDDGGDDDGGGGTRSEDRGDSGTSFWNMPDVDMARYFKAMFGARGGAARGSASGPSTWRFAGYEQFDQWMQARYAERDYDGMYEAFIEQPEQWKVRFTKESRKSQSQHYKDWIAHMVTGSPLPAMDPPVARTTPRPGPDGKTPVAPAAPPPAAPSRPKRNASPLPAFDLTAIVQFARELGTYPTVRRMLGGKRGYFDSATRDVVVRRRLSWNTEQVGKTLAHEIGHLVDLAISLEGKGLSIARKLKPLLALKNRIKGSAEIKKQAKALSAKWRGPFTPNDKYRNSADELFADYFSAMLNDPEMVNQEFPILHDVFQELADGKPDFKAAYDEIVGVVTAKKMAGRIIDQFRTDVKRSSDLMMQKPEKKLSPIWESGVRALANDKYRARQKEQERTIGEMLSEKLEYVGTWAHNQTAVFENEWKKRVVPMLPKISKDVDEARAALSAFVASQRVIEERKAAGKLFENDPRAAREVLNMLVKLSPLLKKHEAAVAYATPAELYDLAATIISDLHMAGDRHVDFIAKELDRLLAKAGISEKGHAIMTAFDVRGKLLNPYGLTEASAKEVLSDLRSELGPQAFSALESTAREMRGLLYKYQELLHKEGLISDEVYRNVIAPNKDNYVPFVVIDHFDGRVAAAVMQQHGTTKGILDVTLAIPMKVAAINSWRQTQRATKTLIDIYEKAGAPYVVEQRLRKASDIHAIQSRNIDETSRLVLYKNGSPYVAEFMGDHGQTLQHALAKDRFLEFADLVARMGAVTGTMAQVYTTLSLSFMAYNNPIRGLRTAMLRFGAGSTLKSMRNIPRAVKAAKSYSSAMYGGKMNDDAERFVEQYMLNAPRIARAMYADSDHARALLDGGMIVASQINGGIANQKLPWWELGGWPRKAFQGFSMAMQSYEAFEKMMHYYAAKEKGMSESKALALGRRGGIPNPTLGGTATGPFEVAFMWTRVHVQGMRITQEILRDPDMRKGFAVRFMMYEMIPRIAMWAIATGWAYAMLGGDDEEKDKGDLLSAARKAVSPKSAYAEAMRRMNPHKMALGNMIPVGYYDPRTGKEHAFSEFDSGEAVPDWYEVRSLRIPSSEEGRLWGALFYNWLIAVDGKGGSMDYARGNAWKNTYQWATNQLLVDVSPPIAMTGVVGAMTLGDVNPESTFGPFPLANEELFEAGGKDKAQAIAGYVLRNAGGLGEVVAPLMVASGLLDSRAIDPVSKRSHTDKAPTPELLPMGRSVFAHDNYGQYRLDQAEKEASEEQRAKLMLKLPQEIRGMMQFYRRNSSKWKTLDTEGKLKYQYAKEFTEKVWGDRPKREYDPATNEYKQTGQEEFSPLNMYAKGLMMMQRGASDEAWATWERDLGQMGSIYAAAFASAGELANSQELENGDSEADSNR